MFQAPLWSVTIPEREIDMDRLEELEARVAELERALVKALDRIEILEAASEPLPVRRLKQE